MNYGKSNLSRRKKRISSKKRMKKKRVGVRLFKAFVLCILLLGIVGVAAGGVFVKHVIDNTPEVTAKDILPQGYTTSIVDQNGTVLEQLKDSDSNRVYKKYDEISKYMGDAFVAIEDERFYKHNGIDLQGIIRAGVVGVTHGFHFTEGASTLTQQLIKNSHLTRTKTFVRKIEEALMAIKLEQAYDKDEILEKSRRDNDGMDERFKLMQWRASYLMLSVMMVVWALLFLWDSLHGQSTDVSFAIVMSGIAAMNFYQFYQFRYKTALGAGVLVTVAVISVVVHHIFATM